jgi:hypothetical protein
MIQLKETVSQFKVSSMDSTLIDLSHYHGVGYCAAAVSWGWDEPPLQYCEGTTPTDVWAQLWCGPHVTESESLWVLQRNLFLEDDTTLFSFLLNCMPCQQTSYVAVIKCSMILTIGSSLSPVLVEMSWTRLPRVTTHHLKTFETMRVFGSL